MTGVAASTLFGLRRHEAAALLLLLASAVFYALVLRPDAERLGRLERALGEKAAASQIVAVNYGVKDSAARLAAFYAFFDRNLSYADWLARFYDIAARSGVEARQAEYRRTVRADVPLVLHEVALPVSGDYVKVRAFAEGVLDAIPVVSLDQISVKRQQPGEDLVDAELKFTFYMPAPGRPE